MTKTFIFDGTVYAVTTCTAIAYCDLDTGDRQNALLIENTADSGEKFQKVCFGYDMPYTTEDFADMCEDTSAWESDHEVLATVLEREVYFLPRDEHWDNFFGSAENPECVSFDELKALAIGWAMPLEELLEQVREATEDEIAEYGVC